MGVGRFLNNAIHPIIIKTRARTLALVLAGSLESA